MGACFSDKKPENEDRTKKRTSHSTHSTNNTQQKNKTTKSNQQDNNIVLQKQNKAFIDYSSFPLLDDEHKDMEIWEDNIYIGEGVKRDLAYKSKLKIDEINEKRSSFWQKVIRERPNLTDLLKQIRTACYVDHGKNNILFI